ncbi:unnamed protein product [Nippostrongylus brasiliensis]|uniref:DUF2807 domain-containing protein n=1 Tax=Nippostrongylus brasiliensis TaxID=27835 RepID=A0A158QZF9_NIPBR|nr:unnamed protein product [Nippostrongylus brasiliensis]
MLKSFATSGTESSLLNRSSTPKQPPSGSVPLDIPKTTPIRPVEEFPEFKPAPDSDAYSFVDDSLSIATSTGDESNLELDVVPEEEDLFLADVAEDASTIDDNIMSDKIHKVLVAKKGNVLVVDAYSLLVVGNIFNKDFVLNGKIQGIGLSHKLNVSRLELNDCLRLKNSEAPSIGKTEPQIDVNDVSAQLDDEVLAHLGAFVLSDEKPRSKVRFRVNVINSNIEIQVSDAC